MLNIRGKLKNIVLDLALNFANSKQNNFSILTQFFVLKFGTKFELKFGAEFVLETQI